MAGLRDRGVSKDYTPCTVLVSDANAPRCGDVVTGESTRSLINIRASVPRGMHGLYEESRHVGKFQGDHRSRALRQTKGAWPHTAIFCRIYGAQSVTTLLQDTARVSRGYMYVRWRNVCSLLFQLNIDYPGTGRSVAREMAYEGSACRATPMCSDRFLSHGSTLTRIKSTSLTVFYVTCDANFSKFF